MKKLLTHFIAAILGSVLLLGAGFGPAETFANDGTMYDLGTLGGKSSNAFGMNDLAQVVGQSETRRIGHRPGKFHTFLWTPFGRDGVKGNREMKDLGTLGGDESLANDINNAGQVVGSSQTAEGEEHATLWNTHAGTITDLGTLGGSFSVASSINDYGQVTGMSETETGSLHAFLWTPQVRGGSQGTMMDLGSQDGLDSYGSGINHSGQIAGFFACPVENPGDEPDCFIAFLWSPDQPRGAEGTMVEIGSLGGGQSLVLGLNRRGQITGVSLTAEELAHAFLWTPEKPRGSAGSMRDLGTLGGPDSFAAAVNDFGQVAGDASIVRPRYKRYLFYPEELAEPGTPYFHAWLWTPRGRDGVPGNRQMRDIGTLGGASSFTHAMNNWGMVSGASNNATGAVHAFLWVP